MSDPVIELSLCLALALLFSAAAWHKGSDRVRFDASLRAYQALPSSLVTPTTWLLPLAELTTAVALLFEPTRHGGALAAVCLLALYTAAISINLARGRRDIDCGCFASSARVPLSPWLVVRNVILIAAAGALLIPVRTRTLVWVDALTIVTAVVTVSLLWTTAQRLAQSGPMLRQLGGAR